MNQLTVSRACDLQRRSRSSGPMETCSDRKPLCSFFQRSFERSCGVFTMNMCLVRPVSAALIDGFLAYTRVCVGLDAAKAGVKTKPGLTSFLRHANTRQTEEPLHWVLKAYHRRFFFCLIEYKVLICRFTIMLQECTPLYNCAWISIWHTRIEIGKCLSMVDSLSNVGITRNDEKLVERISVEPRRYFFFSIEGALLLGAISLCSK